MCLVVLENVQLRDAGEWRCTMWQYVSGAAFGISDSKTMHVSVIGKEKSSISIISHEIEPYYLLLSPNHHHFHNYNNNSHINCHSYQK